MYEIEMENGTKIKITENHKVLTHNNIWKRVKELTENDEIVEIFK
jgi:intein/homing endonuclease